MWTCIAVVAGVAGLQLLRSYGEDLLEREKDEKEARRPQPAPPSAAPAAASNEVWEGASDDPFKAV